MTNKFFTELARCLRKQGITSEIQKDRRLEVFLHAQPALFVSPKSEVFLLPEMSGSEAANDLYHEVARTADEVWAYVEAVQTAPLLHAGGLSEEFHLLADFSGAVLAGRDCGPDRGYQFVTWTWEYGRAGVSHGHYYEGDFAGAKRDFAVRSGLISKAHLFLPEELTQLYRASDHLLDEGPELGAAQLKALQSARAKIEYTVPDLAVRLEESWQEHQMNM